MPPGPEPQEPGENKALTSPINELESRLLRQRKVLVFGAIDDKVARDVTGRLLALAADPEPIDVYVNSPGGHVESGDTIHDMIRFVDAVAPVRVIGTGWVASAGALIFLAGAKERRLCLPNTRFLLHQPMGGVRGPATDINIEAIEIIKMRERINRIIARAGWCHFGSAECGGRRGSPRPWHGFPWRGVAFREGRAHWRGNHRPRRGRHRSRRQADLHNGNLRS